MIILRSVYTFRLLVFLFLFWALLIYGLFHSYVQEKGNAINSSEEVTWPTSSLERACYIEDWNKFSTSTLPHSYSRWLWMKLNLSSENNMNYTALSIFSAFVYPEFISITITSQHLLKTQLFCRYLDCNRKEIAGTEASVVVFPESIVYCPRRRGAAFISLTRTLINDPTDIMPLRFRAYVEPVHEFSVCVAPLYGDEPKWLQIVEFIEHHKLQGATFFYIYIGTISKYDRLILDDYVKTGEVEIIEMRDKFERPFFSWHSIEIQDCHHRSKYHSKWTAFVDINERIETFRFVPVVDLLRSVENDYVGEFQMMTKTTLKTESVAPRYENVQKLYSEMIFRKFTNSTEPSWKNTKAIVRSDKIGIMGVNGAVAKYPGVETWKVPRHKMVLRHYRNTKHKQFNGTNYIPSENHSFSTSRLDLAFSKKLTMNVIERVKKVYEIVRLDCKWINESAWKSKQLTDPCIEKPETF